MEALHQDENLLKLPVQISWSHKCVMGEYSCICTTVLCKMTVALQQFFNLIAGCFLGFFWGGGRGSLIAQLLWACNTCVLQLKRFWKSGVEFWVYKQDRSVVLHYAFTGTREAFGKMSCEFKETLKRM